MLPRARHWVLCGWLFVLVCSATAQTPATLPPPSVFVFKRSQFKGTSVVIEVVPASGWLRYRTTTIGRVWPDAHVIDRYIPIPRERWSVFSRRLDSAQLWSWRERYDAAIIDGFSWQVQVEWDGRKISSAGLNAGPEGRRLHALIAAIAELMHGSSGEGKP